MQDARIYQIGFLTSFLLLGWWTRDWTLQPAMVAVTIGTCVGVQAIGLRGRAIGWGVWLSPIITGLGLSLLLRADHYSTVMLAASAAIGSKFLLRVQGKHVFNPGNFGIVTALLLTGDAWVSPGQWGESGWYAMAFLTAGGLVLERVGRWDTSIAFLGSYAALEAIRNLWLGWTWDVWLHRLMSGSLLLFALFMITDPRTIPNARSARLLWAGAIAGLTFILRNVFFVPTAVFWALFALAPLTIFLDWVLAADRFSWSGSEALTAEQEPTQQDRMGLSDA